MAIKSKTKPAKQQVEDTDEDDEVEETGQNDDIMGALGSLDQDEWADTEEVSFAEIPAGKYQAKIDSAVVNNSKTSGRLQISWQMTIKSGEYKGRKLFKHDGINDEQSRGFTKGSMARLGLRWPKRATGLPGVLEDAVGFVVQVTVKYKEGSDFCNVYFDKVINASSDVEEVDEDEVDDTPAPVAKKPKKPAPPVEEDDDAEVEEDDTPVVPAKKPKKPVPPAEDDEDDEVEAEDDDAEVEAEDEDEAPAPVVKKPKKPAPPVEEEDDDAEVEADDDDEDAEAETKTDDDAEADDADADADAEAEADDEPEAPESVTLNFKTKSLTPIQLKQIEKLRKTHDFDPSVYKGNIVNMLADIAEYVGVKGEFSNPDKVIAKVMARTAK